MSPPTLAEQTFLDNLFNFNSTGFDPFIGTIKQTNRLRSYWKITVAGVDVTSRVEPHVIDIRIVDMDPVGRVELELDDRDGSLPIPPLDSEVTVDIGWYGEDIPFHFVGTIYDLEHGGQRGEGGGRRMWIHAQGADTINTQLKTPMQDNKGDGAEPGQQEGQKHSLADWAGQVTKNAGVPLAIHPKLAGMMQDFWGMHGESPFQHLQNLADQFGGLFHMRGGVAELTIPGENADGSEGETVQAIWGDNLISWRVRPLSQALGWHEAAQQHFDTSIGNWLKAASSVNVSSPWDLAKSIWSLPRPAPNSSQSGQDAAGAGEDAGFTGFGRIIINGEPHARWNGKVLLQGVRPGVDGLYWIKEVQHHWSRPTGYVTTLEVETLGNADASVNVGRGYKAPLQPQPPPMQPPGTFPPAPAPTPAPQPPPMQPPGTLPPTPAPSTPPAPPMTIPGGPA
ncbi:MAG: hypothetical protein C5B60_06285 [Chloroflexi bacterium]|nr:MAG: hypothetical protein C5B60_06285 [Chloroflexota bacterium]